MRGWLAILLMTALIAACETRPPIDVYGHKDSVYKNLKIGVPF